jgi:hypothetical protein
MRGSLGVSAILSSLVLLAAPSWAQSQPNPVSSAYFTTFGGGMIFLPETDPPTPAYTLSLDVKQPIPAGAVAIAEFENPATSSKPGSSTSVFKTVSATHIFKANEQRIRFISPKLGCVTNGRNYLILVTLYSNAQRTRILGTHAQAINFTMSPAQLERYNIPLCPK